MFEWGFFPEWQDVFDRYFDTGSQARPAYPLVNVREDGERLVVQALVPGLARENLDLSYEGDGNLVVIQGKCENKVQEGSRFLREECRWGDFRKLVKLPLPVNGDSIQARLENGVLEISFDKSEAARSRRIEIK